MAQRLHNNFGTQKEFAFWAVESWALALDVIQSPLAQKIITPEPAPIPTILKPEPKIIVPPKPAPVISSNKIGKFIVQDGVATDMETGLMWLRFAYGQKWQDSSVVGNADSMSWDTAIKITQVFNQQQGYAGCNDWRVPNIDELKTLIDKVKGEKGNYIDADVFPKNEKLFWSSSPSANDSGNAWFAYFYNGYSDYSYKDYYFNVRLVRG